MSGRRMEMSRGASTIFALVGYALSLVYAWRGDYAHAAFLWLLGLRAEMYGTGMIK